MADIFSAKIFLLQSGWSLLNFLLVSKGPKKDQFYGSLNTDLPNTATLFRGSHYQLGCLLVIIDVSKTKWPLI